MRTSTLLASAVSVVCLLCFAAPASAGLTDVTQTGPGVPGGSINKSLAEEVGAGQGDATTYGSSTYIVLRDPARAIRRGRQLFQRKFTASEGLGPRVNMDGTGDIASNRALGAGLADSCSGCHGRPRGAAGFGGDVDTRPDSRDAPHLFGLGLIEMLADEITTELRARRDAAISRAISENRSVRRTLQSKEIDYGSIQAYPDGHVDTSGLRGVDADLRVRPFAHHGATVSIREFIIGAFKDEMGLQASDPVLCAATDAAGPSRAISVAGMVFDPARDHFERPPTCFPQSDPDADGVVNEIDPALVDYMEYYLLNYFKPGRTEVSQTAQRGLRIMHDIGCTTCHKQTLVIDRDRRIADVETVHDPQRGIMNRLYSTVEPLFQFVEDGLPYARVVPQYRSFTVRNIFADFKRHDLGPAFHERQHDGTLVTEFMTEPLWGVATTAPYGHDGRSINLTEVILRHGGEAADATRAFANLPQVERRAVLEFLGTLVLFPPDDTASNLNPGNPAGDPQTEHGSINLGELFQIKADGPE
jgi:Di-haem oxidoreductase, putative peroxidase